MPSNRELILLYHPSPDEATLRAKGVFFRMKVRLRQIAPDQLHQTVGFLSGMDGCEARPTPDTPPVVSEPVMILCGFSASRLDALLKNMRKAQASLPYKAVLTATNKHWPLCELYDELVAERRQLLEATPEASR